MLLRRVKVTLGLVDLDRGKNESAQDYGEKAPGNLPQSWWLRAVGVRRLMVVRMKALRLRAWRGEQICCILLMLLFSSLVLWLRDREQLHEKALQQGEKKHQPKLNSNQTNQTDQKNQLMKSKVTSLYWFSDIFSVRLIPTTTDQYRMYLSRLSETNFSANIDVLMSLMSSFNEADAFEMLKRNAILTF